jgi:hypothetical protein
MEGFRQKVFAEVKRELALNLELLELLKRDSTLEDLASLREVWVEPLERLNEELGSGQPIDTLHPPG